MFCAVCYAFGCVFQLSVFSGLLSAEGFTGQVKSVEFICVVECKGGNLKIVSGLRFKVRKSLGE